MNADAPGVRMLGALRARDPQASAHSAALILLVCAAVLGVLPLFQVSIGEGFAAWLRWFGIAGLVVASAICRTVDPAVLDRLGVCAFLSLGGVALIGALNLLTDDTSAGAQAFFAFPVLWVASHLRGAAVALVTGAALVAEAVTLFLLLPPGAALVDVTFFGAVLVVMAVMLIRASHVQERLVGALQEQLTVDALTGLATRRAFDAALERALQRSVPGGTALVLIDVDSFKSINDTHGHPVGDDVLVHLSTVLRGRVRSEDAVLSRLGGDELAVLMPGCARHVAAIRAEDLLNAVRSTPLTLGDGTLLALSISVGVAHIPQRSSDRRGLYTAADSALYDAKRAGRGRVSVATS